MRIAVIGAGAIGSVAAAYLSKAAEEVVLIGRPDQVDSINRQGLRVKGVRGQEVFKLKAAPQLTEKYDLVIFAVKTQDLEEACSENHEFMEESLILTTQNGVQADNLLSTHFDCENMLSSIVMFGATYIKPGEVTFNFEGDWIIGRPFIHEDYVVHETAEVLKKTFKMIVSEDIMGMKWLKLFVNFNNCLPALVGKSMQETFADLDLCRLSIMLLKEGVNIIQKAGIKLVSLPQFPVDRILGLSAMPTEDGAAIMQKTLTNLSQEPLYGSILQSIMRKRLSEIDYINGEVVLLAKNVNESANLNRKVVDLVHRVEREGKFFSTGEVKKEFQLN